MASRTWRRLLRLPASKNAEDFQGLLAKQSRYVQAQMRNYDLQAQDLGRLVVGSPQGLQPTA